MPWPRPTAAAEIADPAAATSRGAIVITLLALTFGAYALAPSKPASTQPATAQPAGTEFPGCSPAMPIWPRCSSRSPSSGPGCCWETVWEAEVTEFLGRERYARLETAIIAARGQDPAPSGWTTLSDSPHIIDTTDIPNRRR